MSGISAVSPLNRPWLVVPVAAALALFALEWGFGASERLGFRSFGGSPVELSLAGIPGDYAEALRRADLHAENAVERAERLNDGWLVHDVAARAWLSRARLTGSFEDYARAEAALARGFAQAAPRTGPHMTGAVLAFGMHRLAQAESHLDAILRYAVPPDGGDLAETVAMRGDIAFYRGDYNHAMAAYDRADRIEPGTSDFRRAVYYSHTGHPDLAEKFYDK